MKIVFFGTPDFAVPFLEHLISDPDIQVAAVVCQPDKPVGRKQELTAPGVKRAAEQHQIPVLQFPTLRDPAALETLRAFHADAFVLVVYGKILPQDVLDLAPLGVVNVHPSLLPLYRGPSPMKSAILNGESTTGISIMLLDKGVDSGPVLAQTTIALDARETNSSLEAKVCVIGPAFLTQTLKAYAEGTQKPTPQDETRMTMTKMLDREDGHINWRQSAKEIDQHVRAFEPWPGTWTMWNGQRLKVLEAQAVPVIGRSKIPGTVVREVDSILVETTDGRIELRQLQLEGKQPQSIVGFLNGHPDFVGSVLS